VRGHIDAQGRDISDEDKLESAACPWFFFQNKTMKVQCKREWPNFISGVVNSLRLAFFDVSIFCCCCKPPMFSTA
jgi:hypothetical protein